MNEFREADGNEEKISGAGMEGRSRASIWPGILIVASILVAGMALVYAHSQRAEINAMVARDASLNANVAQLQSQLQSATSQLNDIVAQQQAAKEAAAKAAAEKAHPVTRHPVKGRMPRRRVLTASERRYNALQTRLDKQQKELDSANQSIAQTRSDLQANLDSTAAGLNGAIAKNHDELVALEKRGQRNYFEFDLLKNKHFTRTGPISLSLRHADTKHKRYNLMLLVDDNGLEKKNVDLYEPIWITGADEPQPLEIVVNRITKNHIHGYISAPKYSNAELNSTGASLQPVSATNSSASASSGSDSATTPVQTQARPAQP